MKFSRNQCNDFLNPYLFCIDFSMLMEIKGFEPLTPCLQGRCSPN